MTNPTTDDPPAQPPITEIVGRFDNRASFKRAVQALHRAGFDGADLSVLDTHESLAAAGESGTAWQQTLTGMVGEVTYIGPLTAAGLIMIASGPVGAAVAGLIAAGVTGAALKEALDEVRATPHTEDFARALERGAVLLWVACDDAAEKARARSILRDNGAADVHEHQRPRDTQSSSASD